MAGTTAKSRRRKILGTPKPKTPPPPKQPKSPKSNPTPTNPSPPPDKKEPNKKGPGRPQKNLILKIPGAYKTAATGETTNSPFTDPNIIFVAGGLLIIASGWSSGRISNLFKYAWDLGTSSQHPVEFFTSIKIVGSQLLFLLILTILARAIPPLARAFLIMILGMWILWMMKNPQMLKLLNDTSKG